MKMRITRLALGRSTLLTAAMLAVTACSESHTDTPATANTQIATTAPTARNTPEATNTVAIRNFAFQPATLSVVAGSKVVWTNRDEEPHRVVSTDNQFQASPALDTDDSYAALFTKPGTYAYFCSIHPHMVGKIIVK